MFCLHKARVCPTGFRATVKAMFVLICLLREFPLSAIANCFELKCQLKQILLLYSITKFVLVSLLSKNKALFLVYPVYEYGKKRLHINYLQKCIHIASGSKILQTNMTPLKHAKTSDQL